MGRAVPRSLVWATSVDVLPSDRVVERRDGYLVVRSPSNPTHWWGNLLLFDDPPGRADADRWERLFEAEFAGESPAHRTFAWDRVDGALGHAQDAFVARGYVLDETVGLIATPDRLRQPGRANRDVAVRALDPAGDEELWAQVLELQVAGRDDAMESETEAREFLRRRLGDLRDVFAAGRGAWYVAINPRSGEVVGSCGVVVTDRRGRFQSVDTAAAHRRRGICSRLVFDAARHAARRYDAGRLVIAADPHYHALGIYESLGFVAVERVAGVCRPPHAHGGGAGGP